MGRKLIEGKNDFASWCLQNSRESLLEEWDSGNNSSTPNSKSFGSHYRAAWKCAECGHGWRAEIKSRTLLNSGCPKCGFAKVSIAQSRPKELGDVESFCKEKQIEWLLSEWDSEMNELKPREVSRSSSKYKIAWKCTKCGYRWKLAPNHRIKVSSDGRVSVSECPMCIKENQTSFPEQAIYYYVTQAFSDAKNRDKEAVGLELDIYIPSIKTAIEYDGYAWHQDSAKDIRKNARCRSKGIKLIRMREGGCPALEEDDFCRAVYVVPNNREKLSRGISDLCAMLGFCADVNLERDEPGIMALYQKNKYENSLGYLYPDLAKEVHSDKNGTLSPENINKRNARKIWWKCSSCDHAWSATVASRTGGHGCPVCSGRVLVPGKNDLETWCKETGNERILAEWDYEANAQSPRETTKKSAYEASWKCGRCGVAYKTRVYNRANGSSCPVCSGKKVQDGINDFRTWCINHGKENILDEWDAENDFLPSQVSHGSGKRILWACSVCGHHWLATLDNRKKGKGCPQCGNVKRSQSNKKRQEK